MNILSDIDILIEKLVSKRLKHSVKKAEKIKKTVEREKKLSTFNKIELQQLEHVAYM